MQIKIHVVKAFTKNKNAGNPAGVILQADLLSDAQMQTIATGLGFSESVFVSESRQADCRLRYFTPTCEVDACAHATIAALHILPDYDSYETNRGVYRVERDERDEGIILTQEKPVFGDQISRKRIAKMFGISHKKIPIEWPCMTVSTGVSKLIVPISDMKTLFEIKPDLQAIKDFCFYLPCKGIYLFTTETLEEDSDAHTRQFNPLSGIDEDPVTGTAAGALGAYFAYNHMVEYYYDIEQGDCMGKAGRVRVFASRLTNQPVKIKGNAVLFREDIIELK